MADRSAETVSAWLKAHPSLEVVNREGSTDYASALPNGAPQARPVSDRWHGAKKLSHCRSPRLAHTFAELREEKRGHQGGTLGKRSPSNKRNRVVRPNGRRARNRSSRGEARGWERPRLPPRGTGQSEPFGMGLLVGVLLTSVTVGVVPRLIWALPLWRIFGSALSRDVATSLNGTENGDLLATGDHGEACLAWLQPLIWRRLLVSNLSPKRLSKLRHLSFPQP